MLARREPQRGSVHQPGVAAYPPLPRDTVPPHRHNPNGVVSGLGRRRRGRFGPGDVASLPDDTTPSGLDRMGAWIPGVAPRASGQPRAVRHNRVAVGRPAVLIVGKTCSHFRKRPCAIADHRTLPHRGCAVLLPLFGMSMDACA